MDSYTVKADAAAHYVRTVVLAATKDRSSEWERAAEPGPIARRLAGTPDPIRRLLAGQDWDVDGIDVAFDCDSTAKKDGSQLCRVTVAVRASRVATVDGADDALAALHAGLEQCRIEWPTEIGPWKLAYRGPVACSDAEPVRELAPAM